LKILEAAASGKAIVSTSLGVEGLDFRSPRHVVVADSPREFADAVIRLATDEPSRHRLERQARRASLAYDWRSIGERLRKTLATLDPKGANADVCRAN
jgi:glycosyltransferase involved in cell wall biosynthesis